MTPTRTRGTARYACKDGSWTGPRSARCHAGCAAATINGCDLENKVHGGSTGSCADGSGACSYTCSDGTWSRNSNSCHASCAAATINGCDLENKVHGGSTGVPAPMAREPAPTRAATALGSRNSNSCQTDCAAGTETWTVGGNSCSAPLAGAAHGIEATATDSTHSETDTTTGTARFECDDGTWTELPAYPQRSCNAGCGDATIKGCALSGTMHNGAMGSCVGSSGSCSYKCDDGTWSEKSNSCPVDCGSGTETWTVGDDSCSAVLAKGGNGSEQAAYDVLDPTRGSAEYRCEYGTWVEQSGSSCGRECEQSTASWDDGPDKCSATLPKTSHGVMRTVTDSAYSGTGTGTYTCNDGTFVGPSGESCHAGCAGATKAGCVLLDKVHGGKSGSCPPDHTGSCSYTCNDGKWGNGSSCTPPRYTVEIDPVPTKGKVTKAGFMCPGEVCKRTYLEGQEVKGLTATPNAGYQFDGWIVTNASCTEPQQPSTCSFIVEADVTLSPQFSIPLNADAGGPYTALHISVPPPFGSGTSFYIATVTATASGGVLPYKFQWSDQTMGGATVTYVYRSRGKLPADVTVTVTDKDGKGQMKKDTASIGLPSADAATDGGSQSFRFEVPLGGEAHFIWGEDEPIAVRSKDKAVVEVGVSSRAFRVTGIGPGETVVVVEAAGGEWSLPVVVR